MRVLDGRPVGVANALIFGAAEGPGGVGLKTFTGCRFEDDLGGAGLQWARFSNCDLRWASLKGADLRGATYDRHTRWPAGFDPQQAGARLVE